MAIVIIVSMSRSFSFILLNDVYRAGSQYWWPSTVWYSARYHSSTACTVHVAGERRTHCSICRPTVPASVLSCLAQAWSPHNTLDTYSILCYQVEAKFENLFCAITNHEDHRYIRRLLLEECFTATAPPHFIIVWAAWRFRHLLRWHRSLLIMVTIWVNAKTSRNRWAFYISFHSSMIINAFGNKKKHIPAFIAKMLWIPIKIMPPYANIDVNDEKMKSSFITTRHHRRSSSQPPILIGWENDFSTAFDYWNLVLLIIPKRYWRRDTASGSILMGNSSALHDGDLTNYCKHWEMLRYDDFHWRTGANKAAHLGGRRG